MILISFGTRPEYIKIKPLIDSFEGKIAYKLLFTGQHVDLLSNVDGDIHNLPKIVAQVQCIDLFHYDSDKRYSGRKAAFDLVEDKLTPDSLVVMDDINDDQHFKELCEASDLPFKVFEFGGKYVGMIGKI